jgi:hypothetical protein
MVKSWFKLTPTKGCLKATVFAVKILRVATDKNDVHPLRVRFSRHF